MTEINYRAVGNVGLIDSVKGSGREQLRFTVRGYDKGFIKLADTVVTFDGGKATVNAGRLADGEYRPVLILDVGTVELEPIEISGGSVRPLPTEDKIIRFLLKRVDELEQRSTRLEQEQKQLYDQIMGKDPIKEIFGIKETQ